MTTQTYNIQEVKANLPRLLEEVDSGAEVLISREGKPLARISRVDVSLPKIRFGVLKGKVKVAEDFDAPLPEELISEFEGSNASPD